MKKIGKMVNHIHEEICDAKKYAELYIENKADGQMDVANTFKSMAQDELKHSEFWHTLAVAMIEKIRTVYTPPMDMQEKWDKTHQEFIESVAEVKRMLTM